MQWDQQNKDDAECAYNQEQGSAETNSNKVGNIPIPPHYFSLATQTPPVTSLILDT